MLDRGLRARLRRRGRARGARGARRAPGRGREPPARPARAADVHDRPAQRARLRRCDLRRAHRRRRRARVGAHRRRQRARAPRARSSTARPAARDERVRARSGRADAAAGAVQRRLLAGARARTAWRSRSSSSCTRREVGRAAFYRSLIRSDERLDYEQVDRIFAGASGAASLGGAARGRARRPPRPCSGRASSSGGARDRLRGARVLLRRAGQRRRDPRRAYRPSPTG